MNLIQLKYFDAVCTFGTVSEAAEYLHIAQPSLSNAVKELEKEFGVQLFRRHHRGMVLTAEGEALLKMARDILEKAEHTEKIMKDMGRDKKTLTLGVPPMTGSLILPNIYRDFLGNNSDINLEIVECGRQDMGKMLSTDRLDMAFISHGAQRDPELCYSPAARLEIVCCTTSDNPLSQKGRVTPQELAGVPLVMFTDGFFQTSEIKKWFSREGVEPDILMQTAQLSTMLSIISSNTAVGFMFDRLIEKRREYVPVAISPSINVTISLVWKKDKYLLSTMKRFKDYLSRNDLFE